MVMSDGHLNCIDDDTLESLLAKSDKDSFAVIDEDREWLESKPKGMEI